ncbi:MULTISPECIES: glycosyltransferase [Streptomyces]|uniref:D-inositol 3-phosphate glycosyltransferase n=2 Tax=Streptomyces venezuelae TaxID=54571 RepID=F2RLG5_STRVP|nr:glycosyltransferase [Streptomyces venezuelae]APE23592.1 glycosyl transferase [Streptomyces venezuelae]QES00968.1 glycosyltransferase [Streptomyces venezuelae ATCC 10712]CCA57924.1 putative glycosyl transferase [Streptomyces venezuelae ATCC 10712]
MKVLHVITGLGIGGAEQQLRLLLRHLPVRSSVVTLTNPGAVAAGIEADGTPVTHLGMTGNRDLGALPRLARFVRQGRYDLVHTHLYRACVYGRTAARLAGVRRVIATEHSLGETQIEGRPLSAGTRALYLASERLGTSTVAVSPSVARRLAEWGVPPERIRIVPNGIETDRFAFDAGARRRTRQALGLPEDAHVVGGVGRLTPGKRFDRLVRAVASIPDARLLLVGEGEHRAELLRVAGECGAADRVLLAGACEDPPAAASAGPALPELLAAMDVFVSTSPDETFGLAVVEALAAGLPVLYVACPAVDDLAPEAAPGARRIGESVPELISALRGIRDARLARLPLPAAARRYDIARSAEQLMTLYDQAVHGTPLPAK